MAVLEDDGLNLEIEPVKVFNSISPQKRIALGLGGITETSDPTALAEQPAMKQILFKSITCSLIACIIT
jgi:hypothetical protein